jgi:hypothetical protein
VGTLIGGPILGGASAAIATDLMWKGWKWVRDKVLDQHGCYIAYLNRNGQPMDAGLSINQGMVVGRYHTKRLLPGIFGVRTKIKTLDGRDQVTYNEIFKSLGYSENQVSELVHYASLENALVNAEILKYSGTSPDRAGFNQFFKVLCKLEKVIDGDEIEVSDLMNPEGKTFKVRLEGIISSTINVFQGYVNNSVAQGADLNSNGSKAAIFVYEKLKDIPFLLRISPDDSSSISVYTEDDFSPGSKFNNLENYMKGKYYGKNEAEKTIGTIFYRIIPEDLNSIILEIRSFFVKNILDLSETLIEKFRNNIYDQSIFHKKYDSIYSFISRLNKKNYFEVTGDLDPLKNISNENINIFNNFVSFKILQTLYSKASEWPYVGWDEYYNDGLPATLNWELISNNLAQVYTMDLLRSRPSEIGIDEQIPGTKYVPSR